MKNAILFLLLIAFSCNNNSDKKKARQIEKIVLKGTQWSSDFYFYHNEYFFLTDSTGFSRDGQYLWSTPVDPALYNNSRDSIMFNEDMFFYYSLSDSILKISYQSLANDTILRKEDRVFTAEKRDSSTIVYRSAYEYAYGKEYLILKTSKSNIIQ